jgi:hypothetical protein
MQFFVDVDLISAPRETHKYRGSRVAFSISKSVEPNKELKVG